MKNVFLFHIKSPFRIRDIKKSLFSSSFPHFRDSKGQIKMEQFMITLGCINFQI